MDYFINAGCWGSVFAVPGAVVDNYIKLASGNAVKVLLYVLRNSGRNINRTEISAALNMNEDDICDAFNFWEGVGILSPSQSVSAPVSVPVEKQETPAAVRAVSVEPPQKKPEETASQDIRPALQTSSASFQRTPSEIEKMKASSKEMKGLFDMAQQTLGNTINHTMVRSLIWQHEYLGLKPDVIMMLLSYCASIGKTHTSYIEAIAVDWSKNEINTLDKADAEISRLRKQNSFISQMTSAFGLKRQPTPNQLKLFDEWMLRGISADLVACACERAVDQGKTLTVNYINGILRNWNQAGITTREQAEDEIKTRKNSGSYSTSDEPPFNYDDFAITFSGNTNRGNKL